jgi:hypothetical protein
MNTVLQFTRYLYEKDEVKLSLVCSILENRDDALFWAYELYYSGYKEELTQLFWTIYYDFFATLNPGFENYLLNKVNKLTSSSDDCDDSLVGLIVNNFQIRPCNLDVFLMRNIVKKQKHHDLLVDALAAKDYKSIAAIVYQHDDTIKAFEETIDYFVKEVHLPIKKNSAMKDFNKMSKRINCCWLLLSRILYYFTIANKKIKLGVNWYNSFEITAYKTIENVVPRKILGVACLYPIDNTNNLSMFKLNRDTQDIVTAYRMNWLYHASFSKIWAARIQQYKGNINHDKQTIDFENDDDYEAFYEHYNLEPDEQKLEVQNRSIQPIIETKDAWKIFNQTYTKNGLIRMSNKWNFCGKLDYIQL